MVIEVYSVGARSSKSSAFERLILIFLVGFDVERIERRRRDRRGATRAHRRVLVLCGQGRGAP
jgi:hypothetical protein